MLEALLEGIPGTGLLTVRQVADALAVDADTIRQSWIVEGIEVGGRLVKLAALRVGANWRIERGALLAFLEACNPGRVERIPAGRANPGKRSGGVSPAELQNRAKEKLNKGC